MGSTIEAPEAPAEERAFTLANRSFRAATNTTVDQDAFVIKRMRSAGLVKMWNDFNPKTDRPSSLMENVILEAFEAGVLYEILGGMLVEDNVKWSRPYALHNAKVFRDISDAGEKDTMWNHVGGMLIDFLAIAARFSRISPSSSDNREPNESGENQNNNNAGRNSEAIPHSISTSGTD